MPLKGQKLQFAGFAQSEASESFGPVHRSSVRLVSFRAGSAALMNYQRIYLYMRLDGNQG